MLYVLVGTVALYVVARVVWAYLPRMARHRLRFAAGRLGLLAATVGAAGCYTEGPPSPVCVDAGSDAPTLTPCASIADCEPYLHPGPCGALACDAFGLVGEPEVPGVPKGCYVRINPTCETPPNDAGAECGNASDCPAIRCTTPSCVNSSCQFAPEPMGTPCDQGMACDGAGHCVVT